MSGPDTIPDPTFDVYDWEEIRDRGWWPAIQELRDEAYAPLKWPIFEVPRDEDKLPDAFHVVAHIGELLIGSVRFQHYNSASAEELYDGKYDGCYLIRRMAVLDAYRGKGIAGRLLRKGELEAINRGAVGFVLTSTPLAIPLYARHHFELTKRVHEYKDVPCEEMELLDLSKITDEVM